jgi:hypothetical protein
MLASAVMPRLAALYLQMGVGYFHRFERTGTHLSHFARSAAAVTELKCHNFLETVADTRTHQIQLSLSLRQPQRG